MRNLIFQFNLRKVNFSGVDKKKSKLKLDRICWTTAFNIFIKLIVYRFILNSIYDINVQMVPQCSIFQIGLSGWHSHSPIPREIKKKRSDNQKPSMKN